MARRADADGPRAVAYQRAIEVLTRRDDGALLALLSDKWRLAQVQREHPEILLEPLIAG
jgi:peptide chain release factor 3